MKNEIELHDSRAVVSVAGGTIVVRLCPAYVHQWVLLATGWRGEGRTQDAEILIEGGSVIAPVGEGRFEVSDGWIQVGENRHDNVLPVPLTEHGHVKGLIELVNSDPFEFVGTGISVRLIGESKFVERLPDEWAPTGEQG